MYDGEPIILLTYAQQLHLNRVAMVFEISVCDSVQLREKVGEAKGHQLVSRKILLLVIPLVGQGMFALLCTFTTALKHSDRRSSQRRFLSHDSVHGIGRNRVENLLDLRSVGSGASCVSRTSPSTKPLVRSLAESSTVPK